MATAIAALKGKLGNTEYFILSMKAHDLVNRSIIPSEMEEWEDMTLEEREQRDINYPRVRNQIAPYLALNKDRFFGAIILTCKGLKDDAFEPLPGIAKNIPNIYRTEAEGMGFLTFHGGEQLIPLDGQHRLKAIKFAITGRDQADKPIPDFSRCEDLANEDVTVMLVPYEQRKARRIFAKVNRYAKATTAGQNLVIDDDDIIAVLSREITNQQNIIGARLVKYKSNTLNDKDDYFTVLATLADCNLEILNTCFPGRIDRENYPTDQNMVKLYREKVYEIWKFLVENIELFSDALYDKDETGKDKRIEIRARYLLGKPVPQFCLVKTFVHLTAQQTNLSFTEAAKKLNAINWEKDAPEWDRLLMSGGKIITKNKKLVADILYYRCGGKLSTEEKDELLGRYQSLFPANERRELPPLV